MKPEPTRYTFTIPRPGWPDDPAYVHVETRRGAWNRGPVIAWNIMSETGCFWTRARDGFVYRPNPTESGRWTLAEALAEAEQHAVPFVVAEMAREAEAMAERSTT